MLKNKVRVRIAPSPTGYAHVGTAYTALLNFAFARHNNGDFIIRIEDSDVARNIIGAEEKIYEALEWLGIEWDEGVTKGGKHGPYRLSDRVELYRKKASELVERGLAYEDEGAVRFKNTGEDVLWTDLVRGEIKIVGSEVGDFVMLKSDGYPAYNFAVVVDDIAMEITHVIRGEDHVSNTPRQIALYRAFGADAPEFAHHSMLLNAKRQKLSKRDTAVDVNEYKNMGILPEAFVNFMGLLGWSHPEGLEKFESREFIDKFSLERVGASGAFFNIEKLLWLNGEYIREMSDKELLARLRVFEKRIGHAQEEQLQEIIPLIKTRIKTLGEFWEIAGFFFEEPEVDTALFGKNYKEHLSEAKNSIESGQELEEVPARKDFSTAKFFMDLRIAITGKRITPPINESIVILGKEEALRRINRLI